MARETTDDLKRSQQATNTGHGPSGSVALAATSHKAKHFGATVHQLMRYLRRDRWRLLLIIIFAIGSTIFAIVGPKIAANATNRIQNYVIESNIYQQVSNKLPAGITLPHGLKFQDSPSYLEQRATNELTRAKTSINTLPPTERAIMQSEIDRQRSAIDARIVPLKTAVNDTLNKLSGDQKTVVANMDLTKKPTLDFGYIWWNIVVLLTILYIASAFLRYFQGWLVAGITQRLAFRLRRELSQKINALPLSYFDSRQFGDTLSRITNDVDLMQQSLSQSLSVAISDVVTIIAIPIMMFSISWQMSLVSFTVLPVSLIFIMITTKKSQKYFLAQQNVLGRLNGHVEEIYSGYNIVKVFGGEQKAVDKFARYNNQLRQSAWKSQFLSGLMGPITNIVGNMGYVGVTMVGGYLAVTRGLGVGDILAFIQYVQQFHQPIIQLSQTVNIIQPMVAAAERVFNFLNEPNETPDPAEAKSLIKARGAVEFNHVKFSYHLGEPIIKDFNATITPGQIIAIVGPTGAGKTTIVNLLMRFYDPNSGKIQIDGINTRDMKRSDVRQQFAMVLQDTWLFNGTVRENLTYGRQNATDDEVQSIARATHVDHFIRSLPNGYNTVLNEDADNISAGEKQLLTIARAMLANPPMLILDEATSNVDTRTEAQIQHAMIQLMRGRTSFVIAHRLSTIRNADLILVMNHGDIVESGNHANLLSKNGFYAKLYNSQFDEPSD
ncbi:MAG: ABC transporter ATP-binding protein [Candidatus Nanoperiomorbaceae bacterium]